MATKRALIIGINRYPHLGEKFQLKGCVNDAVLIKSILINRFGFDQKHVCGIANSGATQAGIRQAMRELEEATEKDDIVVFHYSGHGHQAKVKTAHSDEGSGKDSCLLPYDDSEPLPGGKKALREIRDDEISGWLARLTSKTPYVTLIIDACHSGTMHRGNNDVSQARSIPTALRDGSESTSAAQNSKPITKSAGGWLPQDTSYVVMSGCRDLQTSKERFFKEGNKTYRHGVLTYSLAQGLQRAQPGTTYRDVFETATAKALSYSNAQNPQIAGKLDREIFGVKDITPFKYVGVTGVSGQSLTLAGGAAHGLQAGSVWEVYPAGTKNTEASQVIGEAVLDSIGMTTATAQLQNNASVAVGSRCVLARAAPSSSRLTVDLSKVPTAQRALIQAALKRSTLLGEASSPAVADVRAVILKKNSQLQLTDTGGVPLQIEQDSWAFFEDDELAFPIHSVQHSDVIKLLISNLEKSARFRNAIRLDNTATKLKATFNVYKRIHNGAKPDDPELQLANGGSTEFEAGERMVWEIRNDEKDRSLFVSVLRLSANKEIAPVFPSRRASVELKAGSTIWLGRKDSQLLKPGLSRDYTGDLGVDVCKAFFTTQQCDYRWLQQSATRSSDTEPRLQPLETALLGHTSRAQTAPTSPGTPAASEDWDAINRAIILKRRSEPNS